MCAGSARVRWICAWWPPAGWTPSTNRAYVWDWAAGALIAAEAGAKRHLPPVESDELIVVAAPGIFDALVGSLMQAGSC